MGSQQSLALSSYEDVLAARLGSECFLISTLPESDQGCLIGGTVPAHGEETKLNSLMSSGKYDAKIIVYGRNCTDRSPYRKLEQLLGLGFEKLSVYPGGLLEWMLLRDAYGSRAFPTDGEGELMSFAPSKT